MGRHRRQQLQHPNHGSDCGLGVGDSDCKISRSLQREQLLSIYDQQVSGIILFQAQQSAACHAIHTVEARLCRWILYSQDVTGWDQIELTHEFLSHMLGVQRSSVSLCAHTLQESGLIRYSRGRITILNRKGIEECACECYSVIRQLIDSVFPAKQRTD